LAVEAARSGLTTQVLAAPGGLRSTSLSPSPENYVRQPLP